MQPKTNLLTPDLVNRILDEAFQLMMEPGIKVLSHEARSLLAEMGAHSSAQSDIVRIPEKAIRRALETAPSSFDLYNRNGASTVHYGGDSVQFDPGSAAVDVLDPVTLEHRPAESRDLVRIVKVTEMLPQYEAQSTAVVCNDVPKDIGDLYRLYLVLLYSSKPIVTGAFSLKTIDKMLDMLALFAGSRQALKQRPQAVFDVCPNPPLIWGEFGSGNLILLARAGIPVELVSMPLAGAVAPVTLLGAVTQHAAECLAGIVIHQAAQPGAPIVWGGAPAIFDMRKGSAPMAAIETAMIDSSYAQVGKFLGLPTHTYLCTSDAKLVDAQAGLESGMTALIGALSGINMISGAGMLDFLSCQSPEKLVIDAEAIAMSRRLLDGMLVHTETLATALFEGINFKGDFLKQRATRDLFKKEQHLPSAVIDRDSRRGWQASGSLDAFARARLRADELVSSFQPPQIDSALKSELEHMVGSLASAVGMQALPSLQ
jgi:trimethylamine--corrinoid protein Co-methyltransferase